MKRIFLFFFLLILLPATSFGLDITFRSKAEISSSHITLGDIAAFDRTTPLGRSLATQRVGLVPEAGESVTLDNRQVIDKLERALDLNNKVSWKGNPAVKVHRQGITVGPKDMQSSIATFLITQKNNLPKAEYSFIPQTLPLPFVIPTGELEVEVIPSHPNIINSKRFGLVYKVDGKVVKNISLRGKLQAMAPVAVLTRNVKRGAILSPDMVTMETIDLAPLRSPCTNLREVLGKKLTQSLRKGSPLSLDAVDFPPLVRKGQLVKMLVNTKGLHLSATGIATTNGKQDQIIRVRNTRSHKDIYCRVAAPGIVEVQI